jgi:hypothetical protein
MNVASPKLRSIQIHCEGWQGHSAGITRAVVLAV